MPTISCYLGVESSENLVRYLVSKELLTTDSGPAIKGNVSKNYSSRWRLPAKYTSGAIDSTGWAMDCLYKVISTVLILPLLL